MWLKAGSLRAMLSACLVIGNAMLLLAEQQ